MQKINYDDYKEVLDTHWRHILGSMMYCVYDAKTTENTVSLITNTISKEIMEPIMIREHELDETTQTSMYTNSRPEDIKEMIIGWCGLDSDVSDMTMNDLTKLFTISMYYRGAIDTMMSFPTTFLTDIIPTVLDLEEELEDTEEEDTLTLEDNIRVLYESRPYELLEYIQDTYMKNINTNTRKLLIFTYAVNVYTCIHDLQRR